MTYDKKLVEDWLCEHFPYHLRVNKDIPNGAHVTMKMKSPYHKNGYGLIIRRINLLKMRCSVIPFLGIFIQVPELRIVDIHLVDCIR